jgi:tRNA(adenine34) deaminase
MATKRATKKTAKKTASKTAKKTYATKSGKRSTTPPAKRWSGKVKTDSTKPGPGLFKKSGKAIAEGLAKKSVSPEGPGQAVRMLNFYENRGGKNLSSERKGALETAKKLLHKKVEAKGTKSAAKKSSTKKSAKKASKT